MLEEYLDKFRVAPKNLKRVLNSASKIRLGLVCLQHLQSLRREKINLPIAEDLTDCMSKHLLCISFRFCIKFIFPMIFAIYFLTIYYFMMLQFSGVLRLEIQSPFVVIFEEGMFLMLVYWRLHIKKFKQEEGWELKLVRFPKMKVKTIVEL